MSALVASVAFCAPALAETTTRSDAADAADAITAVSAATAGDVAHATSSADTALQSATTKAQVEVSRDPAEGVTIASGDGTTAFSIGVPNADDSSDARRAGTDLAVFSNQQTSTATGVAATADGARLTVVIDAADSPTDYAFLVHLPEGGTLHGRLSRSPWNFAVAIR